MHMWTSLSTEQRQRIRVVFNIPRSSHVEVVDGRVLTDGTTPKDFESLTVEKMQVYLKSSLTDFYGLLDQVIARVQDEIEGKPFIEEIVASTEPLTVVVPPKTKRKYAKKQTTQ